VVQNYEYVLELLMMIVGIQ